MKAKFPVAGLKKVAAENLRFKEMYKKSVLVLGSKSKAVLAYYR